MLPAGRQLHPFLKKGSSGWKAEQVELAGETFTLFMQGLYGLRTPSGCVNLSFSFLFLGESTNTTYVTTLHVSVRPFTAVRWKTWVLKQALIPKTPLSQMAASKGWSVPSMGRFKGLLPFSGLVSSSSGPVRPRANTARLQRRLAWGKPCGPEGAQKPGRHRPRRGNEQPLRSELIKRFNLLNWGLIISWWPPWTVHQESWVLFLVCFSNEKEIVFRRAIEARAPRDVRYAVIRLKLNNKSSNTETLVLSEHHYG